MDAPDELPASEATDWERYLRGTRELRSVLHTSDVDVPLSEFHCTGVTSSDGEVTVSLSHDEQTEQNTPVDYRGVYQTITGIFTEADRSIVSIEVEDAHIAGLCAGTGYVWTYCDGEVRESYWLS